MKLIQIGKMGKPHGFRGAFVALTDAGQESALASVSTIYIGKEASSAAPFPVTEAAWMPRGWKVKVGGLDTEDAVKALQGQFLFADRAALPDTEADEYYLGDLVGATVIDAATGERVGTFLGLEAGIDQPRAVGHDRWWIEIAGERRAIPATKRFVEKVEIASRTIWLRNLTELP